MCLSRQDFQMSTSSMESLFDHDGSNHSNHGVILSSAADA